MYQSVNGILRAMTGTSLETQPIRDLRGRAWLNHARHLSGLDWKEFERTHVVRNQTRSNLVQKWQNGDAAPTDLTVAAVEKSLPGSRWVFDLPLWELLRNEPMSLQRLKSMVGSLTLQRKVSMWWLPGDDARFERRSVPVALYPDTDLLVARNDIWGLVLRFPQESTRSISTLPAD